MMSLEKMNFLTIYQRQTKYKTYSLRKLLVYYLNEQSNCKKNKK